MSNDIYKSRYTGQEQEILFNKINNLDIDSLGGNKPTRYAVGNPDYLNCVIAFSTFEKLNVGDNITMTDILNGFGFMIKGSRNYSSDIGLYKACLLTWDYNPLDLTTRNALLVTWVNEIDSSGDDDVPTWRIEEIDLRDVTLSILGEI